MSDTDTTPTPAPTVLERALAAVDEGFRHATIDLSGTLDGESINRLRAAAEATKQNLAAILSET